MNESGELEPFVIRILSPNPLGRLEGVHRVWQVDVRIGLVDHVVQLVQGLEDRGLEVVKLQPFFVLKIRDKTSFVSFRSEKLIFFPFLTDLFFSPLFFAEKNILTKYC